MQSRREKLKHDKIAIVRWFGAFLLFYFCYWWVMMNFVISDFWDPQYWLKPGLLRQRQNDYPGHPLWLIFGSSRVEDGFQPSVLEEKMKAPGAPLMFNFGLSGSDLFRQSICLRRLLADGEKPQLVGIEILGPLLYYKKTLVIDDPRTFERARREEVDLYSEFCEDPARMRAGWWRSRIDPTYEYGMVVPGQTRSVRLIPLPFVWPLGEARPYDKWGWYDVSEVGSHEEYLRKLERSRQQFYGWFDSPEISKRSDRAMHLILDFCRSAGVKAFLFRMPETEDYRAYYPPAAVAARDAYLRRIEAEYGVEEVNASEWIGLEGFVDGHHLADNGSREFTLRFWDELLKRFGKK